MFGDKTILLVEDEEGLLEGLKMNFKIKNCFKEVYEARDAETALKMIALHQPDVVYLDIGLGDGTEGKDVVLPEAVKSNPKGKIIMISAYPEYENECLKAGAYAFVKKPFRMNDFFKILVQCFEASI